MKHIATQPRGADAEGEASAKRSAGDLIARAQRRPFHNLGAAVMAEPSTAATGLGLLLAKLLPAGLGAGLMVLVDPPQSKRDLFVRLFAGLAMSFLLTGTTIDGLQSLALFSFLDKHNTEHIVAVAGMWGALGWFVIGGLAMYGKKFRNDPAATVNELKP